MTNENMRPIPAEHGSAQSPYFAHSPQPGHSARPATPSPPPRPKKKRRTVRRFLLVLLAAVLAYLLYTVLYIYISPDRNVRQIYLVPGDAALIIETSEPMADWQKFSRSEPWQCLKRAPAFALVAERVNALDAMLRDNKMLLSLVGRRDMTISLHRTRADDWDFLILVDLQKASKLNTLKDQIEQVLRLTGNKVTQRSHNGITINEMRDAETGDILNMAFIDNHFVLSYTGRLVEAAIDERDAPKIGLSDAFLRVDKLATGKGLCRVYVNYANLPQFMSIYLGRNEYVELFSGSMDFAGLWFDVARDRMEVRGNTLMKDDASPYVKALLGSGNHRMGAHGIMSGRTALFTNVGFGDTDTFFKELEKALAEDNKEAHDSYVSGRKMIEKYFGISLDKLFFGWMSGEFAMSQSEAGLLGRDPELILAVGAKNIGHARECMAELEKKIRRRSPLKIQSVVYKDFSINHIEMKGFFKLFFGKMFDKFETPYYTFVGDYVVFSNKSASLLSFIEDYDRGNVLAKSAGFKNTLAEADINSTVFVYVDMPKFFPQVRALVRPQTWNEMEGNREVMGSFPNWMLQIVARDQAPSMHMFMEYRPYVPEPEPVAEEVADEDGETEQELMSELQQFYVEKFEGNVLREFYDDGALMSESETRHGKRNGRYREYYGDGKLRVRGKYADNLPRGTWKYYTQEGELERKENF